MKADEGMAISVIRCCTGCAKKLEGSYILIDDGAEPVYNRCAFCYQPALLQRWEISARRRRSPRPGQGGGERRRVGE